MTSQRMKDAAVLVFTNRCVLKLKKESIWSWDVDGYDVILSDKGASCTCEFGSLYGMKDKHLPCKHVLAAISSGCLINGPMLRKRWREPMLTVIDLMKSLSEKQKKTLKEMLHEQDFFSV